ncbi:MAG TPA: hypothetical protein VJ914_24805 [Pseudonocardiaceae bacterium]|nr:hypothetical protein [Pseudonocardiaceae bacterium]
MTAHLMTRSGVVAATINCYRLQCGLPACHSASGTPVMLTSSQAGAIGMPEGLGRRVLRSLRIAMLAGPVLAEPDEGNWLFLSTPIQDSRPDLLTGLAEVGVFVVAPGRPITLPEDLHGRDERWVVAPLPRRDLTPWQAVLATIRRSAVGMAA